MQFKGEATPQLAGIARSDTIVAAMDFLLSGF
jgi:hypothetical protein